MTKTMLGLSVLVWGFLVLLPKGWAQQQLSPLEKYCKLGIPNDPKNIDSAWKDRLVLEFEIINSDDLKSLRTALKDPDRVVRRMAVRALGIRDDKTSADALAELVKGDRDYPVRYMAVDALGFLKMKREVIEQARKDPDLAFWATMAAGRLEQDTDYAALVRKAYAAGIKREVMGSAKVGAPAPDFTALTSDGIVFKLSEVLGKKPIVIYLPLRSMTNQVGRCVFQVRFVPRDFPEILYRAAAYPAGSESAVA